MSMWQFQNPEKVEEVLLDSLGDDCRHEDWRDGMGTDHSGELYNQQTRHATSSMVCERDHYSKGRGRGLSLSLFFLLWGIFFLCDSTLWKLNIIVIPNEFIDSTII